MVAVSPPAFVGRQDALAAVTGALGHGSALVLIQGEPGVGKTRLLYEALATAPDRVVLMAACPPVPEPFPLGPVVDGLRRLRDQVAGVGLSPLGGALRPLLPEWADQLPPPCEPLPDPNQTRHRLFRALTELVERLGVEVLVVEDAHWADPATLEWLLARCTSGGDQRMSLVVTYRQHDVPDGSLLVRLTSRVPPGWSRVRIELEPLDVDQARELVGSMLHTDEISGRFASFLHQHTDGIPLALEETIRLMRDRRDIIRRGGEWTRRALDELAAPPTVRDSVMERVERLAPEARRVLQAAAILAEPADESLLIAVADLAERPGRQGVASGLSAGLLREAGGGRLAFRHVLDAKAVESAIPASVQWSLHRRAAQHLARLDPEPVVRLARHLRAAGDVDAWCRHAEASADLAWESGDNRTTVATLLDLLRSVDHPVERRVRLTRKLGEAAFSGGAALGELAEQVVEALGGLLANADLPPGDRGELRLLLGRMLWWTGAELAAFTEIEAAIPDLGHRSDLAIRAMTNLALPLIADWPVARHRRWLDRAGELVEQAGSPSDRLAFTKVRAAALLLLGEEAGWQAAAEAATASDAGTVPDPRDQRRMATRSVNLVWASLPWGRYADTRRQLAATVEQIQQIDYQRVASDARVAEAYLDWYTGAWAGLADTAAELARADDAESVSQLAARQIVALLELVSGHRTAAERHLRAGAEDYARRGVAEPAAVLGLVSLGRLHLADGAAAAALHLTHPLIDMIARKGVWLWATDIAPVHVDALATTGRGAEAEPLLRRFAEWVADRDAPAPAAALVLCRAIVAEARGNPARAADLFGQAAAAWAALPRPYDELLALERQGRCRLAAGDPAGGLAGLSGAQQRLRDLGARWDADRVARLLRRQGVPVARTWRRGRHGYGDQLSPRELEVVTLVGRGMTNRQVGEALFLSPKTVDRHLRAAMRKLGKNSRTAVAMAAAEAGLLSPDGPGR
ncbi:MAG: AAA family ATPase [Micromonosporaceae bacterium]|nr:AAA family ATPase [Micromonosporaceae bacterium]